MLPKTYSPQQHEADIYKKWEESGVFNPETQPNANVGAKSQERYANILPPPNANGELHIGHASGYVAMDLAGRFQRLLGKKTLLLPGKDHAGIQTQVVFEKKIKAQQGNSRHDLGREEFYNQCYDFCLDRSHYMRNQEKKLGLAADWSREKFTLDPELLKVVFQTFIDMYHEVDKGGHRMVYRGERIINWCPRCASALSDMEVEHEDQAAQLYTFRYDPDFPFAIATTRPETKLGDTAVAVHPEDQRYQKYIGQTLEANFCGTQLKLKIIADKNIDPEFGTGALGVTPAHSLADWDLKEKNGLPIVKVIDEEARIRAGFGDFSEMTTLEARQQIVRQLKKNSLLEKEEDLEQALSVCERCKTAIEPLPSLQRFVDVDHANFSLKKAAHEAVASGQIKIYPERFRKIMLNWIDNVHDWCISRQIWWGPRIPVWYKLGGSDTGSLGTGSARKLNVYGEDVYKNIESGTKSIETRAGEEGVEGYQEGDELKFSLLEEKSRKILKSGLRRRITKVHHFDSIDEMLKILDIKKISPGKTTTEYQKTMEGYPGFQERLKKYGVWAFELEESQQR